MKKEELSDLSYEDFVQARERHWQQKANAAPQAVVQPENGAVAKTETSGKFMLYSPGPEGFFAVFEDSGDSGWFYLYGAKQHAILKSALIYNRANVLVDEDVVDIGWAPDGSVCGLAVWGEFRAFLGVSNAVELRKPVRDAEERGIPSSEWPAGFDRYLETKID
ncbi:MAG TPA: DUF2251 domain-containing protein [Candidatus Acidoferrum sp.]